MTRLGQADERAFGAQERRHGRGAEQQEHSVGLRMSVAFDARYRRNRALIVRRGAWVEHDIFAGRAVRKTHDFRGRLRRCAGRAMLAGVLGDR